MDPRARTALERRGYEGDSHRAQAFASKFFADHRSGGLPRPRPPSDPAGPRPRRGGRRSLRGAAGHAAVVRSPAGGAVDVPDPYYGDDTDFERCLDEVEAGCRGLVAHLVERVVAPSPG